MLDVRHSPTPIYLSQGTLSESSSCYAPFVILLHVEEPRDFRITWRDSPPNHGYAISAVFTRETVRPSGNVSKGSISPERSAHLNHIQRARS